MEQTRLSDDERSAQREEQYRSEVATMTETHQQQTIKHHEEINQLLVRCLAAVVTIVS